MSPNLTPRVFASAALSLLVLAALAAPLAAARSNAPPTPPLAQEPQGQESLANQRARYLAKKYLDEAQRLRVSGRLEEALALLLRAKEHTPADPDVLSALAAVQAELTPGQVGEGVTYGEQMAQLWRIREARARAEVTDRLQAGEQAMRAERYDEAIEQLRAARLRIQVGREFSWGDLPGRADALLAQAERAREEYLTRRQTAVEQEILQQRREQEEAEQLRLRSRVDGLVETAVRAFESGKYELAQDLASQAMQLDPTSQLALDIHSAATKARRDSTNDNYIREKRLQYIKLLESSQELKIPQADILRTDPVTWEIANRRAQRAAAPATVEDADDAALREQVAAKTVSRLQFTAETGDYNEVVKNLRLITGVPILLTPEAKEVITAESLVLEIDVVAPLSLAHFLDLMVGKSANLAWTVRNGVVEITTKARAGGQNSLAFHDVRDLVFPRTSFLPPVIRDIPTGDTGAGSRIGGEGDEKVAYIEADVLQQNIKAATGGETYWDQEGGGTMEYLETGYLKVLANPDMQRRVDKFLEEQRSFATGVVSIETKFLTISQNFLQELGVDFRGLGGSGNKGTEATLDDITNALDDNASRGLDNQGTGDAAGHPSAGAFFNDGGDGDIRGRTENFFESTLGRVLTPNGGATAALTILDDTELQILIRAIEKQEEIQVVNSQLLSVLNNERANMAVINQTSYVRDFDVEVAQASFIADPKVDVIQDGIVLDVRPTIAYDRKNIMLSLQPTVAELVRPIPTFTTSLAGTTLPVTLQLPTLTVRSFATTASVPDGGSVLIGGLREVLAKERRAEVPLLGKIPIISFLFKQEGLVDENSSLAVLVRATITDLSEIAIAGR